MTGNSTTDGQRARRPAFFIVGQMKSGTTALYEMLDQHPGVFMSTPKEPQYFAKDLRARFRPAGRGPLPDTLDEYLHLFAEANPDQLCGEASAIYLLSAVAAEGIAELDPSARIIAVVREPAALIRSLHMQTIQDHNEVEKDLRKALDLEPLRREGKRIPKSAYRPQELFYSEHVRYVDQLQRFHSAFPPDQVMVVVYDDFRADNEGTVRKVLRFLGLPEDFEVEPTEANPTVMVRSQGAQRLLHSVSTGGNGATRALKRAIKKATPARLRRRALRFAYDSTHAGPPREDKELMAELRRRYRPEVERLSEYLDRDLVALWGHADP